MSQVVVLNDSSHSQIVNFANKIAYTVQSPFYSLTENVCIVGVVHANCAQILDDRKRGHLEKGVGGIPREGVNCPRLFFILIS